MVFHGKVRDHVETVSRSLVQGSSCRRPSPRRFRTSHEMTRFVDWMLVCGIILPKTLQDFSYSFLVLQVDSIVFSLSPYGDKHLINLLKHTGNENKGYDH